MTRTPPTARKTATLLVVAALAIPVAAAAPWMSYGTYEPDTTLDTIDFMWPDQPGPINDRVYFNAFTTWGDAGANGAYINPNVGAQRTHLDPAGSIYWEAILGVWTDCNQDGYIGMLETAVREYSATLLLDDSICPPVARPPGSTVNTWVPGANNFDGWVTELIPIGNSQTTNADKRIYRDNEALVWGDTGKPDDAVPPPGIQCQGRARGEAQSTGGLLWNLDCQGNGFTGVAGNRVSFIALINAADEATGLGFGVGSDPRESDSVLNQPTFGSDESDHSAVYLQDCNAEPIFETGDLPGDDADNVAVLRPVPANPVNGDPTSWSVPGTLNYTAESIFTPEGTFGTDSTGNCDFSDDPGQDFYGFLEGNPDVPAYNGKDAAWRNFRFQTASRGTLPANFVRSGSAGVPTDFGVGLLGVECSASSCFESSWFGGGQTYTPETVVVRSGLNTNDPLASNPGADISKAPYYTFYAYTGLATTSYGMKTPGGVGRYGEVQCDGNLDGMHNGWNCDSGDWYIRADGTESPLPGGVGVRAKVGQLYNHRDVDCFDGDVGVADAGMSPAYYGTGTRCQR